MSQDDPPTTDEPTTEPAAEPVTEPVTELPRKRSRKPKAKRARHARASRLMPEKSDVWKEQFLTALSSVGVVRYACKMASVTSQTAYIHRNDDPEFRARWDDALEQAIQVLEEEARRRAVVGVRRPVFQSGKLVGTVTDYSDTLLIFLLKAQRPQKYRDNHKVEISTPAGESVKVEHGGTIGVDVNLPVLEQIDRWQQVFERAALRESGEETPVVSGADPASLPAGSQEGLDEDDGDPEPVDSRRG